MKVRVLRMVRLPRSNQDVWDALSGLLFQGRWRCPHCGQTATPENAYGATAKGDHSGGLALGESERYARFTLATIICGACSRESLVVRKWTLTSEREGLKEPTIWRERLYPVGRASKAFTHAPPRHLRTYVEACQVLNLSPAASACMSRRCIQGVLREHGYSQHDLAKQIEAVLTERDPDRVLPLDLRKCLDAIRNFGNFGAHPINDITTLQIIDVEPNEAEWCIEISEQLIDHYYERPTKLASKIAAANMKFNAGGKPNMKGQADVR